MSLKLEKSIWKEIRLVIAVGFNSFSFVIFKGFNRDSSFACCSLQIPYRLFAVDLVWIIVLTSFLTAAYRYRTVESKARKHKAEVSAELASWSLSNSGQLESRAKILQKDSKTNIADLILYFPDTPWSEVRKCQSFAPLDRVLTLYPSRGKQVFRAWLSEPPNCLHYENQVSLKRRILGNLLLRFSDSRALPLIFAMTIGESELVDKPLRLVFRTLGLSHLLVLSGFHVGVVYLLAYRIFYNLLFRRSSLFLRMPLQIPAGFLALSSVAVFLSLIRSGIPATRAFIFLSFFILADTLARPLSRLRGLGLTASFVLFLIPSALYDIGFYLSFAAVIGIIFALETNAWLGQRFFKNKGIGLSAKVRNYLLASFLLSLYAWIFTLPLTIYFFREIQLLTAFANMIFVPFLSLFFIYGGLCFLGVTIITPNFAASLSPYYLGLADEIVSILWSSAEFFEAGIFRLSSGQSLILAVGTAVLAMVLGIFSMLVSVNSK